MFTDAVTGRSVAAKALLEHPPTTPSPSPHGTGNAWAEHGRRQGKTEKHHCHVDLKVYEERAL